MTVILGNKPNFFMLVTSLSTICILLACGTPPQNKTIIGPSAEEDTSVVNIPSEDLPVIEEPKLPAGAVVANFKAGQVPFYAVVDHIDKRRGKTRITFGDKEVPKIVIPDAYGAALETLRFDEFDRDLLLVKSKLKDPVFTKYYLYIFKNNQWKLVVNGFSIHEYNNPESLKPIAVDPANPNNMKRYYSVFDLDNTSSLGYTWRLLSESVPIVNK